MTNFFAASFAPREDFSSIATFGNAFCFTDGVSTVTLMSRCIGFKLRTSLFNNLMCSGVVPQQPPISFTPLIRKRRAYCDMYSGEHI